MGSVAAPLLAGFSLTLTLLVLQADKGDFRWPDATVLVLVAAAVAFIMVIQFSFWARQYVVTPSELKDWWPDFETNDERARAVFSEQRGHALLHKRWAARARVGYNVSVGLLLSGLALALIPEGPVSLGRVGGIVIIGAGLIYEVVWPRPSV
jgi:hypothetical protein